MSVLYWGLFLSCVGHEECEWDTFEGTCVIEEPLENGLQEATFTGIVNGEELTYTTFYSLENDTDEELEVGATYDCGFYTSTKGTCSPGNNIIIYN